MLEPIYITVAIAAVFIGFLIKFILKQNPGNEKMQEISKAIEEGAMAFLKREYMMLGVFAVIVFFILSSVFDFRVSLVLFYLV